MGAIVIVVDRVFLLISHVYYEAARGGPARQRLVRRGQVANPRMNRGRNIQLAAVTWQWWWFCPRPANRGAKARNSSILEILTARRHRKKWNISSSGGIRPLRRAWLKWQSSIELYGETGAATLTPRLATAPPKRPWMHGRPSIRAPAIN